MISGKPSLLKSPQEAPYLNPSNALLSKVTSSDVKMPKSPDSLVTSSKVPSLLFLNSLLCVFSIPALSILFATTKMSKSLSLS